MKKLLLIVCALLAFNAIAQENFGKLSVSGLVQTEVENATSLQIDYSYNEFINNNIYLSCGAGFVYSFIGKSVNTLSIGAPINLGYRIKIAHSNDLSIYTGVQPTLLLFGYNNSERYDKVYKEIKPLGLLYNIGVSIRAVKKFGLFVDRYHALE